MQVLSFFKLCNMVIFRLTSPPLSHSILPRTRLMRSNELTPWPICSTELAAKKGSGRLQRIIENPVLDKGDTKV